MGKAPKSKKPPTPTGLINELSQQKAPSVDVPTPESTGSAAVDRGRATQETTRWSGLGLAVMFVVVAVAVGYIFSPRTRHLLQSEASPLASKPNAGEPSIEASAPVVFGFLPDYRFDSVDFEFVMPRVTHLCMFGSEADAKTGALVVRLPAREKLNQIRELASVTKTKLFISFGGAGRSTFFSPVMNDATKYGRFKQDLVSLLQRERLHGLELNWMYPSNNQDVVALKKLVEDLKVSLPEILVTMAIPTDVGFARAINQINFDMFHVMVYQAGAARPDSLRYAREAMIALQNEMGKRRILTLGVPFYGTHRASGESISYEEVFTKYKGDLNIVRLEDRRHLLKKKELAKELGLAGLSIWELGQDCRPNKVGPHEQTCPNGSADTLLEAIANR